jgi:hypothetical protein
MSAHDHLHNYRCYSLPALRLGPSPPGPDLARFQFWGSGSLTLFERNTADNGVLL